MGLRRPAFCALALGFLLLLAVPALAFTDVPADSQYGPAIEDLAVRDIVQTPASPVDGLITTDEVRT
jgi:hypothetical protein